MKKGTAIMNYRAIFMVILLYFAQSIHAINPIKLAGMNDVTWLGEDLQKANNYLPFWGLAMVEKNIAQLWYQINGKYQKTQIENLVKNRLTDLANQETFNSCLSQLQTTKTQDLLRNMFHIAGGTFAVTNAGNNPVRQFTAQHIGKILRMIFDANEKYDEELENKIKNYCVTLGFKNQNGVPFKPKDFNPFIKSLVAALQESTGPERLYAENTAQQILLGFMLQRSHELKDLIDYYQGFSDQKLSDNALKNRKKYTNIELIAMTETKINVSGISEFADYICALTYVQNYTSPLPKVSANMPVKYHDKYNFSDCVETTMLNLVNIATYDAEKKLLGQSSDQIKFSSILQSFYDQDLHKNPTEVQNSSVHNAWANIVENMDYVAYLNAGFNGKFIRSEFDGFIPIPGPVDAEMIDKQHLKEQQVKIDDKNYMLYEKQVGSRKYLLVPKSSGLECFEIMPLASNIVVMMNNLFDLNLYVSADEVLQQNFAQKYINSMCNKVGWTILNHNLDKELEKGSITLKIGTMQGSSFNINLHNKAHGYVSINEKSGGNNKEMLSVTEISEQMRAMLISYDTTRKNLLQMPQQLYKNIAAYNQDQRFELIKDLLASTNNLDKRTEKYVASLIVSMSELSDAHYHELNIPDDIQSKTITQALYVMSQAILIKYDSLIGFSKYGKYFVKYNLINTDTILKMIEQGLNNNLNHPERSLLLLNDYIAIKGFFTANHVDLIFKAINNSLHGVDYHLHDAALRVVNSCLVHNLITIDDILKMVEQSLNNNSKQSIDWLKSLGHFIDQHYNFFTVDYVNATWKTINSILHSPNIDAQQAALKVLDSCIRNNLIKADKTDAVWNLIDDYLNNANLDLQQTALEVLSGCIHNKLFKADKADAVWNLMIDNLNNVNLEVQIKALDILSNSLLFGLMKTKKIDTVLNDIKNHLNSLDSKVRIAAMAVVYHLVESRLVTINTVNLVLKAIESSLNSADKKVQNMALHAVSICQQFHLLSGNANDQIKQALKDKDNINLTLQERDNAIVKIQEYVRSLHSPQAHVPRTSMLEAAKKSIRGMLSSSSPNLMHYKVPNELSSSDDAMTNTAVPLEKDLEQQRAQLEKFQQSMNAHNTNVPRLTVKTGKRYDIPLSEYNRQAPVVENPLFDPKKIVLAARRSAARAITK